MVPESAVCISQVSLESRSLWSEFLSIYKGNLLELLIGCSPDNPTMASYEGKVQESSGFSVPRGWVSQFVFCRCWDPKEVGCKASGGMDALAS